MKKTAIKIFTFVIALLLVAVNANAVNAAPRLTLTPVSGSYTNGSTFTVSIGVNSETEKSSAVDVWATFDPAILEVVEIKKSTTPPFPFDMTPVIDNVGGKFDFSCASTNMSAAEDVAINGELAVVTFKAKATGTGIVRFTCTPGLTTDSNIFNSALNDVISCSANSSGSYTITAATASSTTTTPTPTTATSTSTTTLTTTAATTLPQTGVIGTTVGLIVFGAISLISALFLKFL